MRTKFLLLSSVVISLCYLNSCNDDKPAKCDNCKTYEGVTYETSTTSIDIDGDGKNDEVTVLKDNLNVSKAPDGKPLYNDGSGVDPKSCYKDMAINCDTLGALYTPEVSMNQSFSDLLNQTKTVYDKNDDGKTDYLESASEEQSKSIADKVDSEIVKDVIAQINETLKKAMESTTNPKPENTELIKSTYQFTEIINSAIEHVINKNIDPTNSYVDLTQLQLTVESELIVAIIKEIKLENNGEFPDSAFVFPVIKNIAKQYSQSTIKQISEHIAEQILISFNEAKAKAPETSEKVGIGNNGIFIQGICPNGWHIPSDAEWMAFEKASGMPLDDLVKFGADNNTRGLEEKVAAKMKTNLGISLAGYGSITGTYAQLNEAGVFYSSTAGTDENGNFVWVRHFDDSFESVKRYKHYANSQLSIKCFKDY